MGKQDAGNHRTLDILCVLVAKRVEVCPQLGGLRVHLCRLPSIRYTYYFTKSCQRHGQKIIVNSKQNSRSITIISITINKTGGEFAILSHTTCCKPCQTCTTTKVLKLFLYTYSFKENFAR